MVFLCQQDCWVRPEHEEVAFFSPFPLSPQKTSYCNSDIPFLTISLSRMPLWSCMATVWGLCSISPGSLWRLSWVWFWWELASLLALISDISRVTQFIVDYKSLSKQQNNIFFSVAQWYFMSKATSQQKIKSAITAKGNIIYFYIAGKLFIKRYYILTCYFQNLSKLYLSSHHVVILNFNEPQSILCSFFFFF